MYFIGHLFRPVALTSLVLHCAHTEFLYMSLKTPSCSWDNAVLDLWYFDKQLSESIDCVSHNHFYLQSLWSGWPPCALWKWRRESNSSLGNKHFFTEKYILLFFVWGVGLNTIYWYAPGSILREAEFFTHFNGTDYRLKVCSSKVRLVGLCLCLSMHLLLYLEHK